MGKKYFAINKFSQYALIRRSLSIQSSNEFFDKVSVYCQNRFTWKMNKWALAVINAADAYYTVEKLPKSTVDDLLSFSYLKDRPSDLIEKLSKNSISDTAKEDIHLWAVFPYVLVVLCHIFFLVLFESFSVLNCCFV